MRPTRYGMVIIVLAAICVLFCGCQSKSIFTDTDSPEIKETSFTLETSEVKRAIPLLSVVPIVFFCFSDKVSEENSSTAFWIMFSGVRNSCDT